MHIAKGCEKNIIARMKSIFLVLLMVFTVQQAALPASISKAYSGVCDTQKISAHAMPSESGVWFKNEAAPDKDLAVLGQSLLQNLNPPSATSHWTPELLSQSFEDNQETGHIKRTPFLIDHPPQ